MSEPKRRKIESLSLFWSDEPFRGLYEVCNLPNGAKLPDDETIRALIGKSDIGTVLDNGNTLLMMATTRGHARLVRMLLEAGADPNVANDEMVTALFLAAAGDRVESAIALIKAGANVNAVLASGVTPLMTAAGESSARFVEVLLGAGAVVGTVDKQLRSALTYATMGGRMENVECLFSHRASPAVVTADGSTLMHHAAARGNVRAIRLLFPSPTRAALFINSKTAAGYTPLHLACARANQVYADSMHSGTAIAMLRGQLQTAEADAARLRSDAALARSLSGSAPPPPPPPAAAATAGLVELYGISAGGDVDRLAEIAKRLDDMAGFNKAIDMVRQVLSVSQADESELVPLRSLLARLSRFTSAIAAQAPVLANKLGARDRLKAGLTRRLADIRELLSRVRVPTSDPRVDDAVGRLRQHAAVIDRRLTALTPRRGHVGTIPSVLLGSTADTPNVGPRVHASVQMEMDEAAAKIADWGLYDRTNAVTNLALGNDNKMRMDQEELAKLKTASDRGAFLRGQLAELGRQRAETETKMTLVRTKLRSSETTKETADRRVQWANLLQLRTSIDSAASTTQAELDRVEVLTARMAALEQEMAQLREQTEARILDLISELEILTDGALIGPPPALGIREMLSCVETGADRGRARIDEIDASSIVRAHLSLPPVRDADATRAMAVASLAQVEAVIAANTASAATAAAAESAARFQATEASLVAAAVEEARLGDVCNRLKLAIDASLAAADQNRALLANLGETVEMLLQLGADPLMINDTAILPPESNDPVVIIYSNIDPYY
jgi:ankyrin repeat protein